jgi:hypothetical protein
MEPDAIESAYDIANPGMPVMLCSSLIHVHVTVQGPASCLPLSWPGRFRNG